MTQGQADERPGMLVMLRPLTEFLALLTIAVMTFRTWVVEAYRVPSGSMAGALLGRHADVVCGECGFPFQCGAAVDDDLGRVVCPNCQLPDCDPNARGRIVSGDRLLVFKGAFVFQDPKRWEIVVFRNPRKASQAYVKRVVGLPGEVVEIRHGDVYINGQPARKPFEVQQAMAVLVHDARYTSPALPSLWQPASTPHTHWTQQNDAFHFTPNDSTAAVEHAASGEALDGPFDWLLFRRFRRAAGSTVEVEEAPIDDMFAYNTQPRRSEEVSPVVDVLLDCWMQTRGPCRAALHATDGRDHFEAQLDPVNRSAVLLHNGQEVLRSTAVGEMLRTPTHVVLSLFDRQFSLSLDGQQVFGAYAYESNATNPPTPTSRPLAVGSDGLELSVADLKVYRDVYYTNPSQVYGPFTSAPEVWGVNRLYRLGPDEYFVLGDNSAGSEDSRLWPDSPAVHAGRLVGRPLVVHLPYRATQGSLGIQVPDFQKIRYIH